jgi:hypothetical protein
LNRHNTCWRWLRDRDDSPWYPSLRQFRQNASRDWAPVIARIAAVLRDYACNLEGERSARHKCHSWRAREDSNL